MIVRGRGYPVSDADICLFTDVQKSLPESSVDPLDLNYPDHYVAVCAATASPRARPPPHLLRTTT